MTLRHPPAGLILLAYLLLARPCLAGAISVDTASQTLETSRLIVTWNTLFPEAVDRLVFKDYSPTTGISATDHGDDEYWGQSLRNLNSPGFTKISLTGSHTWQVTALTDSFAAVTITSTASGQPTVVTRYTFVPDKPYFTVDRTIAFSTHPDTASYQAFVPRVAFLSDYRALRFRDDTGTLVQRGFCAAPCLVSSWDGKWVQFVTRGGPTQTQLGVTFIYPAGTVGGLPLVRGMGPASASGWAQPRVPAGPHTTDETWGQLVSFSTSPDDIEALDALQAAYGSGAWLSSHPTADISPGNGGGSALRLQVSPNPARGPATLAWTSPVAGPVTLDVLDIAGRRIARLLSGSFAAGSRRTTWDGRSANGARVAPGLYLVRLVTPLGAVTATLVRAS